MRAISHSACLSAQHQSHSGIFPGGSGGGGTFDSGNGRMDFAEWLESIIRIACLRAKAGALGDPASMDEYVRRLMEDHRFVAFKMCLNNVPKKCPFMRLIISCEYCSSLASAFWV